MPALSYQFVVTLADQLLDTSLLPLQIHERCLHIPVLVSRRQGHIARFVKLPGHTNRLEHRSGRRLRPRTACPGQDVGKIQWLAWHEKS